MLSVKLDLDNTHTDDLCEVHPNPLLNDEHPNLIP